MSQFDEKGAFEIFDKFSQYQKTRRLPDFESSGQNIILTGFGLFAGVEYNVSGALAESLGHSLDTNESVTLKKGVLSDTDCGVRVIDRKIRLGGIKYNLRILLLDVMWDFSGAVLSFEMQQLNPKAVLMMGRGNDSRVILEAGALNETSNHAGYCADGAISSVNTPIKKLMFPECPLKLEMTCENKKVAKAFSDTGVQGEFSVSAPHSAREENTYICNNISYIALLTALNLPFKLANEKILFKPNLKTKPQVGFLHLPKDLSFENGELSYWMRGIESALESMVY